MSPLAFLTTFLASPLSVWAQSEARQAAQTEPAFVRGMRAIHFSAYQHASRRVNAALRGGTSPDPTDLKWRDVGETAVVAGDVRQVTRVEPLERLVVIDARWIRSAEGAADRVLDEFNEKGVGSVYSGEDVKLLNVFIPAVIAADRLRYTVESALGAGIPTDVAHRGLPATHASLQPSTPTAARQSSPPMIWTR